MSNARALTEAINERFTMLIIGLEEAQRHTGQETDDEKAFNETEQSNARRELLRVEKQAIRDKELNKKSEQSYIDGIRDMVHEEVLVRIEERLQDLDNIYLKLLGFDPALPPLLDALSIRASSISKIEPLAGEMLWFYDDLIKMVNMPKYRRKDAKGKVIQVDTLRVALSFFGIENMKLVAPSLAFRRWIPQITDPYPEIKTRLWEYALGTAISCKRIAEVSKVDPGHAFTVGLFHDLGRMAVTRLYFRVFDEVHREALKEAHDEKKREEHAALAKIEPGSEFLAMLMNRFSTDISEAFVSKMDFKRVFVAGAMREYADNVPISKMSPVGKVLMQGIAYSRYRMLKANKLIDMDEAKKYLTSVQMPAGALSVLKTTDLRHLNLKMDEE